MSIGENGESKHLGLYPGEVTDNQDPAKRGRVKVRVPGLCEPSTNWALPIGGSHSSGEANRGGFDPPKSGAYVIVAFLDGDVDSPVYFGGWRAVLGGSSDAPTPVAAASVSDAANNIKAYETDSHIFLSDESSNGPLISFQNKDGTQVDIRGDKVEIKVKGHILRVDDTQIHLGAEDAKEALVMGTSWWEKENDKVTQQIAALQSLASAAMYGPAASLVPGFLAEAQALTTYQSFAISYLSQQSFTD